MSKKIQDIDESRRALGRPTARVKQPEANPKYVFLILGKGNDMNFHSFRSTRRAFLKVSGCSVLATQLGAVSSGAAAAELPRLNETDAAAAALGYVHQADTVSAEQRVDATHLCSNCRFYTAGSDGWGPCALFPGKAVAAQGWCQAWVAKS